MTAIIGLVLCMPATLFAGGPALAAPRRAAGQEQVNEKLGEVQSHRPGGTRSFVHYSPGLDKAITSYFFKNRESFLLENGHEETRPLKWLGWKMPEGKSVLLAAVGESGERRKLLIGGAEDKSYGEVQDAILLDDGKTLGVVVRAGKKMTLKLGGKDVGPYEKIEILTSVGGRPAYLVNDGATTTLRIADREHPVEGRPVQFYTAGAHVAWIEQVGEKRQRAVVDGKPGQTADAIHTGIYFSPNGEHHAYVTRIGKSYRGWIDGRQVVSDRDVVAARVFSDGTPVWVEMWREKIANPEKDGPTEAMRGCIVVNGKREDRVLARPVFNLDYGGESLYGASRLEEKSTLVWIAPGGTVRYEEVEGRVGNTTLLMSPDGTRRIFTAKAKDGFLVHLDRQKHGPYDRVELFHLKHTDRFGFVAERGGKVLLVVEQRSIPLEFSEFVSPIAFLDYEMTAVVVGIRSKGAKKEIWARSVPLE